MNAVIYARFSCDRQREESIEGQIRDCKEYAEKNGIKVIDTYVDRALSASKESEKRLDFQRMIRDSGKHLFDMVLVWKFNIFFLRFGGRSVRLLSDQAVFSETRRAAELLQQFGGLFALTVL